MDNFCALRDRYVEFTALTQDSATAGHLVSARQITQEIHVNLLNSLRGALADLQARGSTEPGVAHLRIRDWWIVTEEGEQCVEIFLDKGYTEKAGAPGGVEVETRMSLEECAELHSHLLESGALDAFGDSVEIRVGSPGGEPFLRDPIDFRAAVGCVVELKTWTKRDNRDKFVMLLTEANQTDIVLTEGPHTFPISMADVRCAQALPYHPLSIHSRKKGKGPRGK